MAYPFFILCLLLLFPALLIFILRRDLRKPMSIVAGLAVPFAFTEFLFYPDYWEPGCLFDLPAKIGFGIEDFLFVSGLGAFTSAVYPFVSRKSMVPMTTASDRKSRFRVVVPIAAALGLTALLYVIQVPIIWGCVPIMLIIAVGVAVVRPDLARVSLWGGILSATSYFFICLVLGLIIPEVFALNWHAEKFSNIYLAGVPLEEVAYAFAAGTISSIFFPFAFKHRFQPLNFYGR